MILADTKFEFGTGAATGPIVLADEVLTPDSCRYWPAADWQPGRTQASFDKQIVRDWLLSGRAGGTARRDSSAGPSRRGRRADPRRYVEAFELLTGERF